MLSIIHKNIIENIFCERHPIGWGGLKPAVKFRGAQPARQQYPQAAIDACESDVLIRRLFEVCRIARSEGAGNERYSLPAWQHPQNKAAAPWCFGRQTRLAGTNGRRPQSSQTAFIPA